MEHVSEIKIKRDTVFAMLETGGNKTMIPIFAAKENLSTKVVAFIDGIKNNNEINFIGYAGILAMNSAIDENIENANNMALKKENGEEIEPIDYITDKAEFLGGNDE